MRKIKVAQVITRMDWGGSPDVLRIICQKLDPKVYDLRIFIGSTSHPTGKTKVFFNEFSRQISFVPELKRDICPWSDLKAFWKLFCFFKKERFDVVHTHTAKAGALGRLAAGFAGIPVIIHTPHGHNFYGYFNRFASWLVVLIERFLAQFSSRIISLTRLEQEDYLRFKVASGRKSVLVYMGLELEKFRPEHPEKIRKSFNIISGNKVVGYIGRLDPIKGPQFFLQAAKLCLRKDPSLKFILIGEGKLRQELESKVSAWELADKIIFAGWREDIPDILSVLDILVLPSLNEAVGIVLIEAQSLGVAIVASEVGGIPEIVQSGRTGILVKPADPAALAQAINALFDDPARLAGMSEAARIWVKDRFRAENMVAETSAVYLEALKEKNVTF